MFAAQQGRTDCVLLLLHAGVAKEAKDMVRFGSYAPLHRFSLRQFHVDALKLSSFQELYHLGYMLEVY